MVNPDVADDYDENGQYEDGTPEDSLRQDADDASTTPESTAEPGEEEEEEEEEEDGDFEEREPRVLCVNGETPVEAAARQLSTLLGY
eukprot:528908-Pyramimonas_sp.AAC.1